MNDQTVDEPADIATNYGKLTSLLRRAGSLSSIVSLLNWDQETMMPPAAAPFRAEELSLLSELVHERLTDPVLGDLLARCEADPEVTGDPVKAANLREVRREFERATRIPSGLVAEISATSSRSLEAWKRAREEGDFHAFRPWLEKQIELARGKAECIGAPAGGELYDALLEEYEPGMNALEIAELFGPLRGELAPLIAEISDSGIVPDQSFHFVKVPVEDQKRFNLMVSERMGFDTGAGRLDVSVHPFTEGLGPGDTRITSRYADDRIADALSSTMHETGHALYEQGLPKSKYPGQPLGRATSMAIHESMSRLWENQVGRSLPFWEWALSAAGEFTGSALERFSAEEVYRAVNTVAPSLIRVEADEATYNLHVMLRFDLEVAMIRGDLHPVDLPAAWNDRMKQDLGLDVPGDAEGCLQDIHWSLGAFGYFPTYTLGNIYSAQIWATACEKVAGLPGLVARGEFGPLLGWLQSEIHTHGSRYRAGDLVRRVTGFEPDRRPMIEYLKGKLRPIYSL